MHIPDGWLSPPVLFAANSVAIGALTWATIRARRELQEAAIPLMGVMGAFIFAAQMINLPIPGGTSGHLMGGTLLAIVLGPAVATLVMAAVLLLQALLFADGGLLSFGANFINMGLVGTLGGYFIYRGIRWIIPNGVGLMVGTIAAAWIATVTGAALAGLQLGLSGTAPVVAVTSAMVAIHMLIGVLEAVLTVVVVRHLRARRPELFALSSSAPKTTSLDAPQSALPEVHS